MSFPLKSQSTDRVSNLELTAKFKASLYSYSDSRSTYNKRFLFLFFPQLTTALENSVDTLLKSAGLKDEDIHQTEEAMPQMNQLKSKTYRQMKDEDIHHTNEALLQTNLLESKNKESGIKAFERLPLHLLVIMWSRFVLFTLALSSLTVLLAEL